MARSDGHDGVMLVTLARPRQIEVKNVSKTELKPVNL